MKRVSAAGFAAAVAVLGLSLAEAAGGWSWEEAGRRDPFVFRDVPKTRKERRRKRKRRIEDEGEQKQSQEIDPEVLIGKAEEAAEDARRLLADRDFDAAASAVSELIPQLARAGLDLQHEALLRLHVTATRLKRRAAIEQAFGKLRIDVRGVIWEEAGASALVNDRIVREGDVVEGARVKEIRRDEILFEFKGVLVRRGVR